MVRGVECGGVKFCGFSQMVTQLLFLLLSVDAFEGECEYLKFLLFVCLVRTFYKLYIISLSLVSYRRKKFTVLVLL